MIFETHNSPFSKLEIMEFSLQVWVEEWYPLICDFLKIDSKEDLKALKNILEKHPSNISEEHLLHLIKDRIVYAIAPGLNLEDEFTEYLEKYADSSDVLISADGATSYLVAEGIIPDFIVTDLDGTIQDQLDAQKEGSIPIVHIHGDNIGTINENINQISKGEFLITTQTHPLPGSYNFLGFTDGDRIVCLSTLMSASKIGLIGFDFGNEIGKYSKVIQLDEEARNRKLKKFIIAKSIMNWCSNTNQEIFLVKD